MSATEETLQNVIAVGFDADASAYEALTRLKELDSQGQIWLRTAAIVMRDPDGTIEEKDEVSSNGWSGTAGGGLLGLLIGVIGGPLGVLIGGATGLLLGSLFDLDEIDDSQSVLSDISRSVRVGHTSLLAELGEQSDEVVDAAMARLGGTVVRRSTADVEMELAAAEDAQHEAKKKARKELREARREKRQAEAHDKVEALKAKLHPEPSRAGSES